MPSVIIAKPICPELPKKSSVVLKIPRFREEV
jgi:hypothetical protein